MFWLLINVIWRFLVSVILLWIVNIVLVLFWSCKYACFVFDWTIQQLPIISKSISMFATCSFRHSQCSSSGFFRPFARLSCQEMLIFGKKCFSNFMSVVALLDNSTCKSVGSDFCVQLSLEVSQKRNPLTFKSALIYAYLSN